ncbi:transcriptional regulator SUPERMAN-like [Vigna unguiculata]|uniref:transcriptional regulator SUPERMAN-like n=1 Tax=Vigna unguiculata TaxID=3917 RepID=UPI0010170A17|nr:transcriptional regulator SUPERMAN-like [Vigna unguiculata]
MEGNYLNRNSTTTPQREDSFGFEEHTWGNSWPARNYACSFCKREFRSAQALGGHMNVHRRDRARLRSSLSSWVSECPKPNPSTKPNKSTLLPTSSSPSPFSDQPLNSSHPSPLCTPCLTLSSSPDFSASTSGDKKPRLTPSPLFSPQSFEIKMMTSNNTRSDEEMKGCVEGEEHKGFKDNDQNITLELGIGLIKHQEKKLDLELRLGHF